MQFLLSSPHPFHPLLLHAPNPVAPPPPPSFAAKHCNIANHWLQKVSIFKFLLHAFFFFSNLPTLPILYSFTHYPPPSHPPGPFLVILVVTWGWSSKSVLSSTPSVFFCSSLTFTWVSTSSNESQHFAKFFNLCFPNIHKDFHVLLSNLADRMSC